MAWHRLRGRRETARAASRRMALEPEAVRDRDDGTIAARTALRT